MTAVNQRPRLLIETVVVCLLSPRCQPDDPLNCLSVSPTNECVPHSERHAWGSCQKHVLQLASVSLSLRRSDRDILCRNGNRSGFTVSDPAGVHRPGRVTGGCSAAAALILQLFPVYLQMFPVVSLKYVKITFIM